ncbi:DUF4153 domain-containing protein [Actibacterium sp. MT2.3-13A]|uniref:DUF4153 domain-containing protein n=1 Tax=Actibacterium sp. MT2.3-13A TaxID=2828332 RepID=UPI001BA8E3CC|nr:DUF4153 domain-containing protein [Actibacterium sp. MT2.3-13A]
MNRTEQTEALGRLSMALVGALAGLAMWMLSDVLPDLLTEAPRLYLFLSALAWVLFSAWLAMAGPLSLAVAGALAAALALPAAGLLAWASLRFDTTAAFFQTGHPLVSFGLLSAVPLPFVIAWKRAGQWNSYPQLFQQSWNIVVRYAAAWLFVGTVWAVLTLSDALLKLVGIDVIEWLLEQEVVPYLLTGVTLGLALAVVNELSDYVSPYLVLRLLRLLLPVVLAVVLVFLAALPMRGLSNLFGEFSAAATLLAMAMGALTLVTTALDADDEAAVQSGAMRLAAQVLALLVPALAVLAGEAIRMRVVQYGWSPDRLAAATLAAVVLGYGLAYALAVLRRRNWAARIRQANIVMALAVIALALAWLTPLIDPQKLATAHQVARFRAGAVGARQLDLWTIGREWGRAGRAGLDRLAALSDHPEAALLAERLAALDEAPTRYAFERQTAEADSAALIAALRAKLPVRPEGAALPEGLLEGLRSWELEELSRACGRSTPGGNPGCVLLRVELSDATPGDEAVLVTGSDRGGPVLRGYFAEEGGAGLVMRVPEVLASAGGLRTGAAVVDDLIAGEFSLRPVAINALVFEGGELFFGR